MCHTTSTAVPGRRREDGPLATEPGLGRDGRPDQRHNVPQRDVVNERTYTHGLCRVEKYRGVL